MKKVTSTICVIISVYFGIASLNAAAADTGQVVKTFYGCSYFVADGPGGLYVLEWYGGYDPSEGDTITGEIRSYGMKDVSYNQSYSGRVWVEDFLLSSSSAIEKIKDKC